jgi:hypothetical protein
MASGGFFGLFGPSWHFSFQPPVARDFMLRIIGLLFILWGLGWLASEMPSTSHPKQPSATTSWRRTSVGWERADQLQWDVSPRRPAVHPVFFSVALLSFALSGLIGLAPDESTPNALSAVD